MGKGRTSNQLFLITIILLIFSSLTFGKTITVGVGVGYDYSSIQIAIDAADEGDTIIVAQGIYNEAINFKSKNIILTSTDPNDWNVVENTSITYRSSVVTFNGQENENCILQGLLIYDGRAEYGGGINGNGTKATIRKCKIYSNDGDYQGGGLHNCDGLIDECIIYGNNSETHDQGIISKGGGLYACDGTIKNCIIKSNSAGDNFGRISPGEGGGLYSCNGQIINCTIENNISVGNGGGLHSCNAEINNCLILHNKAGFEDITGSGGGLYNCSDINNCTVEDNSALGKGGGLHECNGTIIGCTIKNNESTDSSGGGLANCNGTIIDCTIQGNTSALWHAGGAIDCNSFTNCTITENTARGYGGGLYNCNIVDRCIISDNSSEIFPGGGLSDCNSVTNSIISGNTAGGNGAGLYDCNEIINCTIVGNYSYKNAGAIYLKNKNGILDNTIVWDNRPLENGQILVECNEPNTTIWNLSIDYSDIQGGQNSIIVTDGSILKWEPNNIDTYPMFVQPGNWFDQDKWNGGDYHLLQNSPCIDTGNPARDYADQNDIDGDARLIRQLVDMGADEVQEYVPPVFVQLEISGPEQVNENQTGQYIATGLYDDDTHVTLTNEVTWSVEPQGIGTIDVNGLFSVGELQETTEVTIQATYSPDDLEILFMAQMTVSCVDIPGTIKTYHVDQANGNNSNDGLSRQTAFKTIQYGINAAQDSDTVLVYPGVYQEGLVFWGKNITLRSAEDAAIIENPDNIAVLFCFEETNQCKIENLIIRNSEIGILNILNSSPTIKNLTIVNNNTGIQCFDSNPEIRNCILWENSETNIINRPPQYCCIQDQTWNLWYKNISEDPLFVDPDNGDYHLKSERGRYWPQYDIWVLDEESSPCMDAGNPNDDFTKERQPNGGRINMGAYGNTSYASMSLLEGEQYEASNPNPANGTLNVFPQPTLSWTSGLNATQHDIYLGTNLDNVRDATRDNPLDVLAIQGHSRTYFNPTSYLAYNQVYFWRVDEIDSSGTITKGDIWTFTVISGGNKSRSCFTAETPVWIDGKMIEISKVAPGQIVGKADSAKSTSGTIKGLEKHSAGMNPCYEMTLESGNTITIVHSHYFMTDSGKWVKIEELSAGMKLQTMNGLIAIKNVVKKAKPFLGASYNLMLNDSEQYFVGKDGVVALDCSKKTWEILEEARK